MIITRKHGLALIRQGHTNHAGIVTCGTNAGDKLYVCITRTDKQRTDHFPAIYADQKRLAANAA